jgi:hypothetical protein
VNSQPLRPHTHVHKHTSSRHPYSVVI